MPRSMIEAMRKRLKKALYEGEQLLQQRAQATRHNKGGSFTLIKRVRPTVDGLYARANKLPDICLTTSGVGGYVVNWNVLTFGSRGKWEKRGNIFQINKLNPNMTLSKGSNPAHIGRGRVISPHCQSYSFDKHFTGQ